ncbi:MAG: FeS assembly scaffold SufA [Rhodospirillales bacterium]|nr:FeS assembly scaffold SufA [Alphaproteobacteria bacterium]MCB9987476.1 FeS assembly scaffold SufA [Rhodospirillales bacterium]USO07548.1 MAG: FeS assembly scaffold SufA [Rhodospirillales bacterium]
MKPLVTVSSDAAAFLAPKLEGFAGVLVRMNKKGCAGGEYEFTPLAAADVTPDLDVSENNGVKIYFAKTMLLSLIGAELVLHKDRFNTRLDFRNPNELSRCGCGESVNLPQDSSSRTK